MSDAQGAERASEQDRVLANSAVMAAGTVVSRMSGFVRSTLLAAALGAQLHADVFNIANTIPNMLYILLAGGIFNAVLVPQLVRAMRNDPDGGEAYTNRVITLAALFLGTVTVLLVVAAPWLMRLFLDSDFNEPALAAQRDSVVDFARYCLPQVFFYGMFVLVGQVLNARGRFGPMMWAPIANNVISVGVLAVYLLVFGPAEDVLGAFSSDQELVLGLGSTLGIAAQFVILVPYLRKAGFTYRPRFDFRGTGLGHTLRLGVWTVLFVIVNQVAYTVVVRLASSGTASSADGTGYSIYSSTFLIMMVPHSVVTVSLATAILPRLSARAAENDLRGLAGSLTDTLRSALAVVLPFALLLPVIATDLSNVVWGHGAAAASYELYAPSLGLFGAGLAFFTVHYLMLRGFYALERTRTVFWIQCAVGATNIAAALLLVRTTDAEHTSPALVLAYTASYLVGAAISYAVLHRLVGGLRTDRLVRFLVRTAIAAGLSTAAAAGTAYLLHLVADDPHWAIAAVWAFCVTAVDVVVFVALARVLHLREVTTVVDTILGRVRRSRVPS
ncbi:murein biosynthesis integral membrane protein MurJ [Nocardioides sp. T2.26MG-1]|uniref:murein biosynthesis integral membrane protein MurJ n=1 Tax=Nocardioides sp. T2.26MG-1 TaxID=3041166 RepID=UPI0024776BC8|nr:murein biosynthesis integral membrane protein MurJ [Nocardioides sp. T2.26MG-1]CAI9402744.1 putative peptidoglycan biosynthesis protein MviN [Nocardioides sp. T2.26MG-1]